MMVIEVDSRDGLGDIDDGVQLLVVIIGEEVMIT